jgi:hypothetical protein
VTAREDSSDRCRVDRVIEDRLGDSSDAIRLEKQTNRGDEILVRQRVRHVEDRVVEQASPEQAATHRE